mmetsp:Transcript_24837/g.34696  ORF Transcript_24837/g.34696 Transcript_24837/m.34696 type:complete len:226 (-) Transcript_24837:1557-2234(-)
MIWMWPSIAITPSIGRPSSVAIAPSIGRTSSVTITSSIGKPPSVTPISTAIWRRASAPITTKIGMIMRRWGSSRSFPPILSSRGLSISTIVSTRWSWTVLIPITSPLVSRSRWSPVVISTAPFITSRSTAVTPIVPLMPVHITISFSWWLTISVVVSGPIVVVTIGCPIAVATYTITSLATSSIRTSFIFIPSMAILSSFMPVAVPIMVSYSTSVSTSVSIAVPL